MLRIINSRSTMRRFAYEAEQNDRLSRIKTNEPIVAGRWYGGYRKYRVPGRHVLSCSLRDRTRDTSTSPYSHAVIGVHVLTHARLCVQRMSAYGNDRPRNADQAPAEALRRRSHCAR